MLTVTQVGNFELPKQLHCTVRPYQQEGIAWLAFLRRTGLHGCLADDMGLGKTLQATAIIAGLCHACNTAFVAAYIHVPATQLCWHPLLHLTHT